MLRTVSGKSSQRRNVESEPNVLDLSVIEVSNSQILNKCCIAHPRKPCALVVLADRNAGTNTFSRKNKTKSMVSFAVVKLESTMIDFFSRVLSILLGSRHPIHPRHWPPSRVTLLLELYFTVVSSNALVRSTMNVSGGSRSTQRVKNSCLSRKSASSSCSACSITIKFSLSRRRIKAMN